MRYLSSILAVVLALGLGACTSNEPGNEPGNWNGGAPGGGDSGSPDMEAFTIEFDTTPLSETETVPTDESDTHYDDYIEHSSFTHDIAIAYNGNSATVSGLVDGVSAAVDGAHVTVTSTVKGVNLVLSGTTDNGSLKVYGDYKYQLTLNGVHITNPAGAAINNQCKKRTFVVLTAGSDNSLTDGDTYADVPEDEDLKGCFFSEAQLLFSGSGTLNVTGSYKHGICSDDYVMVRPGVTLNVDVSASSGIKANDGVFIKGGVLNVGVSGTAAKAINSEADVVVDGGRTTVITTGDGTYDSDENDTKAAAGIKADANLTINGGTVLARSTGKGGKGLNADGEITVNGGTVRVITTGQTYTYNADLDSKAKGIKADGNLTINGGDVMVRTSGGEGSEGIESKAVMTINDGTVQVVSYDDALNAKGAIAINGGQVYAYATNNDAIDSNGKLTIAGGTVIAAGAGAPEGGFDCDNNTFAITGGTVIGLGGDTSVPTASACTQPCIISGNSVNAGTTLAVTSGGKCLLVFKVPRSFSTMVISAPGMAQGSSVTLSSGVSASGGTTFHGLTTGCTASGGNTLATVSLTGMVATSNYGGGPGGWGGMPF